MPATTSFFYGGSSPTTRETTDALLADIEQKLTEAQSAAASADGSAQDAAASAAAAKASEDGVSQLAQTASDSLETANAALSQVNDLSQSLESGIQTAIVKADEAATSAAQAAVSADQASAEAAQAQTSASSAASSEASAQNSATAAQSSANAAATSATQAASSASQASTKASQAASSASAAQASATAAQGSETASKASETNAATSALAAANSATAASSSASQATSAASTASTKASEAAQSATQAASSAANAANSAAQAAAAAAGGVASFNTRSGNVTLTSDDIQTALGYKPYNGGTNPKNFVKVEELPVTSVFGRTGAITLLSSDVLGALGFTPYNATNPNGFITAAGAPVQSVFGRTGAVSLLSSDVTGALGFTPYDASNPNGFITSSASITGNAATATTASNLAYTSATDANLDRGLGQRILGFTTGSSNFFYTAGVAMEVRRASGSSSSIGTFQLGAANLSSEEFYVRKVTGYSSGDVWSPWRNLWHSGNFDPNSRLPVAPALTLATATEQNSISISAPTYSTDKPVKLLNFDWYGSVWSLSNIRSAGTPSNGFGVFYTPSGGSQVEAARFKPDLTFQTNGFLTVADTGATPGNGGYTGTPRFGRFDRPLGSMVLQLGGADNARTFEVIDRDWTTVVLGVGMSTLTYKGNSIWHAGNVANPADKDDLNVQTFQGSLQTFSQLYCRQDIQILNSAGTGWYAVVTRNGGSPIIQGFKLTADRVTVGYDPNISGSISCSNWFRSSGASGWFNATYGGGIYMNDTTWVRTYNQKGFFVEQNTYGVSGSDSGVLFQSYNTTASGTPAQFSIKHNLGGVSIVNARGAIDISTTAGLTTNGNFTAGGNVTAYSDRRLKKDIAPIKDALGKLLKLSGVVFKWAESGQDGLGLIAQEVQEQFPAAVLEAEDANKTLSVAYGNLIGPIVEALREIDQRLKALEA